MADRGEVKIREGRVDDLIVIYQQAYKQVVETIVDATDAGKIRKAQTLSVIRRQLTELGVDVDKWVRAELPKYYLDGATVVVEDLRQMGVDVSKTTGFAVVNREAIKALTDETALAFAEGITGIGRNASAVLSVALKQQLNSIIAQGKLTGETRKVISNGVKETLKENGLGVLIDKGGRKWDFDVYSRMLVRTKAVEARNQGLANRMLASGYDLVQVTRHGTEHPACQVWEGKILSLTGNTPGYPTLAEAKQGGLFHPNCKHAINAINPDLARKTHAYDNPYLRRNDPPPPVFIFTGRPKS